MNIKENDVTIKERKGVSIGMKYNVTFSCGHKGIVDLFGKHEDREKKISYFEKFGLCKSCYIKKKENEPLSYFATVLLDLEENTGNIQVAVWFEGGTNKYKDQIKAIGKYRFSDESPIKLGEWTWNKTIRMSELEEEMKKAKEIGAKIRFTIESISQSANYKMALKRQERWEDLYDELSGKKPDVPEILKGHKWNHKIYGIKGKYSIYIDGEKQSIDDDTAKKLEEYIKKKEKFTAEMREREAET